MIIEDILDWVKTLPIWQQIIAFHLIEKKAITKVFLDEVFRIFKIEMNLERGELPKVNSFFFTAIEDNYPSVLWKSVGNLHGVNKLKSDAVLNVSEGLTVIYGENGSGKSGYTRLLNNAFISRGDQEILHNIFSDMSESVSAEFKFIVNDKELAFNYPEKKEEFVFKTIRTFDSKSATDDMFRESTIDFAPSDFRFFDSLLSVCTEIQNLLDEERKNKKIENPTLKFFQSNGKAFNYLQKLSASTTIDEVKSLFNVTDEDKKKYEMIKKEKYNLLALDINRQISVMDQVIDFLKIAEKKISLYEQAFSLDSVRKYEKQIKIYKKRKLIYESDGLSLFDNDNVEKLGSQEWKKFIISAKQYFDIVNNHNKCPLCGKHLTETDIIFKYWKYLESDAEINLNLAEDSIKQTCLYLKELDFSFLIDSSIQKQWLMDNYAKETERISSFFCSADETRQKMLKSIENCVDSLVIPHISKPRINTLIEMISNKKNSLNQSAVNARLTEIENFESDFIEKTKVNDLLPLIESFIDYLKWDNLANKCKIKTGCITKKQNSLFEKYVTTDYISTFTLECRKLSACFDVDIAARGSCGRTLKKLQIKGNSPGRVLSEGEQRAIAIANFLTEVQMDSKNTGIVLDDPVCSLDHKRRSLIVKRLLDEAKKRQVVVFTHEITFFMELKSEAERFDLSFNECTIRNIGGVPGNISPVIPWQGMNVRNRIKKLNSELQEIELVYKSDDIDKYYYKAKEWCELLRESWERAVEEILFNDAIQRYNPCVQTQRLNKAPFSNSLFLELKQGMTDCSAWCHDQARAINGYVPSLNDLKQYIKTFENFCNKNRPK